MSLFKILRGDSSRISTTSTPFHDGYAYFTPDDGGFYIDANNERIRINPEYCKICRFTLSATGWNGNTYTLQNTDFMNDSDGILCLDSSDGAVFDATVEAEISIVSQVNGSITLSAGGTTPSIDIPVAVVLVHK